MKKLSGFFCVMFFIFGISGVGDAFLVIEEVYYNAPGDDTDQVFTEIYGDPHMNLDNYWLVGINGSDGLEYRTIDLTGAELPANGLLVIAQSGFDAFPDFFTANVDWQNGVPDAVQLFYDHDGSSELLIDALQYGGDEPLYGEGAPAPNVLPGQSLSRSWGIDTDDNYSDFIVTSPTPGAHVPIPGAVWLLGSGLIGLVTLRRKLRK